MVDSIRIAKIANGYLSSPDYATHQSAYAVYHKDIDSCFKHLTEIFNNKTQVEFTGEIKYTKTKE